MNIKNLSRQSRYCHGVSSSTISVLITYVLVDEKDFKTGHFHNFLTSMTGHCNSHKLHICLLAPGCPLLPYSYRASCARPG